MTAEPYLTRLTNRLLDGSREACRPERDGGTPTT